MNNERSKAEEDLRVIRSLMERATVYRAISAPAALVAGLLSILAAGAIYRRPVDGRVFAAVWLVVLVFAVVTNAFFIWREARNDGRPFHFIGNEIGAKGDRAKPPHSRSDDRLVFHNRLQGRGRAGASRSVDRFLWIGVAFYRLFSHRVRSLCLGWAFLLNGSCITRVDETRSEICLRICRTWPWVSHSVCYHLIYAVCAWPRKRADGPNNLPPNEQCSISRSSTKSSTKSGGWPSWHC